MKQTIVLCEESDKRDRVFIPPVVMLLLCFGTRLHRGKQRWKVALETGKNLPLTQ
ncbi:MAG: hypothetical protein GY820_30620 [Gammaproteobacteria bacterium]|nr:hypothetical protein [Gammaproteobacteria bacterium]